MTHVDWRIQGPEITNCNCAWGCPCQFNALPTYGDCRAAVAMRIDKGHFGDVRLDDLRWVAVFSWPQAIHLGNGEALIVIEEKASPAQRDALLKILSGQETVPGATIFNVFAGTLAKVHDPVFAPIEFEANEDARTGHFSVKGIVETTVTPIRNPVTGAEHRARVTIPQGFEYHHAEYASGATKAKGAIVHDWTDRHAHITQLNIGTHGVAH
jgi:hypothetical protein